MIVTDCSSTEKFQLLFLLNGSLPALCLPFLSPICIGFKYPMTSSYKNLRTLMFLHFVCSMNFFLDCDDNLLVIGSCCCSGFQ